jgi:hypothetical protein
MAAKQTNTVKPTKQDDKRPKSSQSSRSSKDIVPQADHAAEKEIKKAGTEHSDAGGSSNPHNKM